MTSPTTPRARVKIVPDTGFYIAAVLKNGYARSYLVARGTKFLTYQLYTSEAILQELQEKLESNKFGFGRGDVVELITQIREVTIVVHPRQKLSVVRDSDDDKILECALEAKADMVLSFDADLLSLKEYEGISIVHPRMLQFM